MTKYSKKKCKNNKNKTRQIKRRKYIHKNSLRINKLHGGNSFKLTFTVNNVKYTLIKRRDFFGGGGDAGKYTLVTGDLFNDFIIFEFALPDFMDILRLQYKDIMLCLYVKLHTEQKDSKFHFNSLYAKFDVKDMSNIISRMSIAELSNLYNDTSVSTYIHQHNELKKLFNTVSHIYNELIDVKELDQIYEDIPISEINPVLPSLITSESTKLGEGTFGEVYHVEINSVIYALKKINNCETIRKCINKMKGEVIDYYRISSLICSSGNNSFCKFVSTYFDYANKNIYVLMEHCGTSLLNIINKDNKYTKELLPTELNPIIYKWLKNIAVGLKCMHDKEYVHLDIKPANITITDNDESKIIDFGLIFKFTIESPTPPNIRGTYLYMSLEQLSGNITDIPKCDIYSLGITFIECAFGLHYPIEYRVCFKSHIFYSILRYDTTSLFQPSSTQQEITLYFFENRGISPKTLSIESFVDKDKTYSIKYIRDCVDNIFKLYPVFKEMIITEPTSRCTIEKVIAECDRAI
jgi:hypothetical protein